MSSKSSEETVQPGNQDIFIVAPKKEQMVHIAVQDIIIAGTDGILYHVNVLDWLRPKNYVPINRAPEKVRGLINEEVVLAYPRLQENSDPPSQHLFSSPEFPQGENAPQHRHGYYLANFALVNNDDRPLTGEPPSNGDTDPFGGLFRITKEQWTTNKMRPGDSVFVLQMLQRGTTFAYIPPAARTTDCVCYVLNLASLNGVRLFEPKPEGASCEIPTRR